MTLVLFCFVQPRRVVVEYKAVVEVVEEAVASVVSLVFCFFFLFSFGTCCAGCRRCRRDEDTVEEDRDDEDWSAAATVKLYATTTSNTVMNMGTNNRFVIISIITITLWLRFYSVGFLGCVCYRCCSCYSCAGCFLFLFHSLVIVIVIVFN